MQDVIHIRLVDGTQIVGRYIEENRNNIIVEMPMLIETRLKRENAGIILNKYNGFSEEDTPVAFKKAHVISHQFVHDEFSKFYENSIRYNDLYVETNTIENMRRANQLLQDAMMETELMNFEDSADSLRINHEGTDSLQ